MEILLGKNIDELTEVALSVGLPRFAGKQLAQWLYQKRAVSFDEMTNISAKGRAALAEKYTIGRTAPVAEARSVDGTIKYLFQAPLLSPQQEGRFPADIKSITNYVEAVYLPPAPEDTINTNHTLCLSTQAGCKMGCKFCMTGTLGFHGHLTAGDILNQIFSIPDSEKLTNLVYMGEGEPCDNIDAVLRSLEIMTASWGCAWSPRRITVSSVGYLPGLKRLLDESDCHVAISLHNPFPQERAEIMPIEKAHAITDVIRLLQQYDWRHQRRISFEYICFGGKNDTMRHAQALKRLLNELDCRINLIRFHTAPSDSPKSRGFFGDPVGERLVETNEKQMVWLRDFLTDNGITTTIRRSRGEDILAACGMLVNALQQTNK